MARVCEICGKKTQSGAQIARRGLPKKKGGVGLRITGNTLRKFKANVQRLRVEIDGEATRIRICTRCIKSGKVVKPKRKKASAA
ncbi:MAG: 50S ribosomal protein L28 [Planctomycetes bacterium]|nr:50S ribosomal protein L28 [Planctomycetota bacterium]